MVTPTLPTPTFLHPLQHHPVTLDDPTERLPHPCPVHHVDFPWQVRLRERLVQRCECIEGQRLDTDDGEIQIGIGFSAMASPRTEGPDLTSGNMGAQDGFDRFEIWCGSLDACVVDRERGQGRFLA